MEKKTLQTERVRKKFHSKGFRHIAAITVLFLLATILFGSFLFSDKMLHGEDTIAGLDARMLMKKSITEYKQFPLWFPSRLGGMPSIDAMFGDAMYIPTLILNTLFPIHRALGLRLFIHVFLAGVLFYVMLNKGFGMAPMVSFIGAVFYMLNPQFVSHIYPGHDGKMFVIAWLPLVVWRLKCLIDNPKLLNSTFLAISIAICLYTSHIQMTYFVLWGVFAYWITAIIIKLLATKKWVSVIPLTVYFWVAVFLGIALGFAQLYPAWQFIRDRFSVRGIERGFDYAASWSLHWPEFFSLWVPEFCGWSIGNDFREFTYWSENYFKLNTEYSGALATLFGIYAVITKPKRPWRIFWVSIAVLALLYSMGANTFVFSIAYYLIPGVKKFRAPSMMMFWFSFALAMLSSLFLNDLVKQQIATAEKLTSEKLKRYNKLLVFSAIVVFGLSLLFSVKGFVRSLMDLLGNYLLKVTSSQCFDYNFGTNFVPMLWLWFFMIITIIGFLWALINKKIGHTAFLVTVIVVSLIDLYRVNLKFVQVENHRYYLGEKGVAPLIAQMRKEPFRIFSISKVFNGENGSGRYGLEDVDGFHDNELRWYRQFRGFVGDKKNVNYIEGLNVYVENGDTVASGNAFLDIANVRYLVARLGPNLQIVRNISALPRLSFAPNYVVIDTAAVIQYLKEKKYNYRTTVALDRRPLENLDLNSVTTCDSTIEAQANFEVLWLKYTPNYRKAEVVAPCDGFLRISEVYYPGWEVRIDGSKVSVYRSELAWMAVPLKSGKHTVEMIPRSLYLTKGLLVTLTVLVAIVSYWIVILLTKKTSVAQKPKQFKA